jgi:hypothetical protein
MPRFKPKGVLERSAASDLWKHTLSQIPSLFGRLTYLASLRDAHSGIYRHHGLASFFGHQECAKALRSSHESTFLEWLAFPLREKYGDLTQYLATVEEPRPTVIEHWLRSGPSLVPASAGEMGRELFSVDLRTLLEAIKNAPVAQDRAS